MPLTPEDVTEINAWRNSVTALKIAREAERTQRDLITTKYFPNKTKGTQRTDMGWGAALKLVHKLDYKLDQTKVEEQLDKIEAVGNEGVFLAERLVKISYDLSVSEYQKLDDNNPTHKRIKDLVDEILTIKDAAPVLEFEEPKVE